MFSIRKDLQKPRAIFLMLTLITLVAYFNSLRNGFISDDISAILFNPNIQNFGHQLSSYIGLGTDFSNFFIYKFFGANPVPYRFLNILFHIVNTWLIYLLLTVLNKKKIAFFAACIFAVHPVFVESVTWISGGNHSRYATYFLLSFIFYLRSSKNMKLYILSVCAFAIALQINIKAVSLPLVFPLYELVRGTLKKNWRLTIPYVLLSCFSLVRVGKDIGTFVAKSYADFRPAHALSLNLQDDMFLRIPYAIYSYLILFTFPINLTFFHLGWLYAWYEYLFIGLVFLLYCSSIIYFFKKNKFIFFWLVFFIIPILPELTPVRVSWIVAERYAYISGISFAVLAAMTIQKLISLPRFKLFGYALFVVLTAILMLRTVARNNDWKNELSFWEATARVSYDSYRAHNDLGNVYLRNEEFQKAEDSYNKSLAIYPKFPLAHLNRAILYTETNRTDEALESAKIALALYPDFWLVPQTMGRIYFKTQNYPEAEKYLRIAQKKGASNKELIDMLSVIEELKK